ncbi:hypothetical protein D1AOALGA4SA_1639 [Olavius algarvensis Delta 1 endosymbiont]|nr:hypothetical protein D1AOALGA4SA_1639 [Olavius algarvensis Delta 1 endosymbiont]
MNVEHRTPNIEHRIMYSVYLNRLSDVSGRSPAVPRDEA